MEIVSNSNETCITTDTQTHTRLYRNTRKHTCINIKQYPGLTFIIK